MTEKALTDIEYEEYMKEHDEYMDRLWNAGYQQCDLHTSMVKM